MMRWILKLTGYTLLVAVFALCLYTIPPTIESEVLANAKQTLKSHGMAWVLVSIDGRDLSLSGTPPSDEAAAKAVGLLRNTTGVRRVETSWSQESATNNQKSRPVAIDIATIDHSVTSDSASIVTNTAIEHPPALTLPTQQAPNQEFEN